MEHPKIPLVAMLHRPMTARHLLWHFCFGVCQVLDGLASVVSLGSVLLNLSILFVEADLIYDHETEKKPQPIAMYDEIEMPATDEEIRAAVGESLGIPADQIIITSPPSHRGPVPKKEDWN